MFWMVGELLVVVELLVERLLLEGYRLLRIEKCFVEEAAVFDCRVEKLIGSSDFEVVFVVVDL